MKDAWDGPDAGPESQCCAGGFRDVNDPRQFITTKPPVGHPKWWFSKGIPLISGKSRLVKYYNLARQFGSSHLERCPFYNKNEPTAI